MKTVFRALFVENGRSLITIVRGRVEKHSLRETEQGDWQSDKLWSAKIPHGTHIVEAPQANRIVATDTSGKHYGLCRDTGEILWHTKKVGEGDSGLIWSQREKRSLPPEEFVFATWRGLVQRLDPIDGKEVAPLVQFPTQLYNLHLTSNDQRWFVESSIPPTTDSGQVVQALNLLDLEAGTMQEVMQTDGYTNAIRVSPDGEKALLVYAATGPEGTSERWEIKDLQTGATLHERTFEPRASFGSRSVWSPDGRYIAAANIATINEGRHRILAADTLDVLGSFDGKQVERPAFHPDGRHVCLCRAGNTTIMPLSMLKPRGGPTI